MEQQEAIEALIDDGVHLEKGNWHLWKSKAGGEYVLLQFNDDANPLDSTEERFPADTDGRSDASAKFLRKVRPSS